MLTFEEWWSELRSYAIQLQCLEVLSNNPEAHRHGYECYLTYVTTIEEELAECIYVAGILS
jgi:hypothetical protein